MEVVEGIAALLVCVKSLVQIPFIIKKAVCQEI